MQRVRYVGKGVGRACSLRSLPSPHCHMFTNQKLPGPGPLGFSRRLLSTGTTDQIIGHWRLTQASAPLLFLELKGPAL